MTNSDACPTQSHTVDAGNGHLYIISNVIALLADVVTAVGNEPRLSTFTQALNVSGIGVGSGVGADWLPLPGCM